MAEYIKSIVTINIVKFKQEIIDSNIAPVVDSVVHHSADDSLYIYFDTALSTEEETTLDGLIAAHDPAVAPLTPLEEFDRAISLEDGSRSNALLSTSESTLVFNEQMSANGDFLSISSFAHSDAGYVMPQNGRIVKVSGRAARQSVGTKYLDFLVDDTVIQDVLTFGESEAESQFTNTTDIAFVAGQRIRAKTRMGSGKKMYQLNVVLWIRWEI